MTTGQRAGLWLVLCLVGGGACAFLTLEGVGIPYAAAFLLVMIFLSRRFDFLPESLAAFGLAFTLVAARFGIPWVAQGNFATASYFVGILVLGIGFIVAAVILRRPARSFRR